MTDWQQHWNEFPRQISPTEFLRQVGKTVNGVPIQEAQVDALIGDIIARLALGPGDRLLDLCCGNGFVTARCAAHCASVLGVDFSRPLLEVARAHFAAPNVDFVEGDVRGLPPSVGHSRATKVLMYEALQHFSWEDAHGILQSLRQTLPDATPLLFASVPDAARLRNFYNTPERLEDYRRRLAAGTEAIGHWWTGEELQRLAVGTGHELEIHPQHPSLHTSHYRFDVLFRRTSPRAHV